MPEKIVILLEFSYESLYNGTVTLKVVFKHSGY